MEQIGHNSTGLVHQDDSWTCKRCGWVYPNVHPSAKHRRNHKKHCGKIEGFEIRKNVSSHQGGSSDDASSDDEKIDNQDSKPSSCHDAMKNGVASAHSLSKESIQEKSEEHTSIEENLEASAIRESEASKLIISNKPINTTQNEEINEGVVLNELQKPLESKPLTLEGEDTNLVKQDDIMYKLEPECIITAEKEEKPTCIENRSSFVEARNVSVNAKPVLVTAKLETLQSATVINSAPDVVIIEKAGNPLSSSETAIVASSAALTESKEAVLPKELVVSEKDKKETGLGMVQIENEERLLEISGISPEEGKKIVTLDGFENPEVGTAEFFVHALSHQLSGEENIASASVKQATDLNDKLEPYSRVLESGQNVNERWDKSVTPESLIVGPPKEAENESEQLNGATITTPEVGSNHYEQSRTIELQEEKDLMKKSVMQTTESTDKEKLNEVLKPEVASVGIAEFLVSKVKEVVSGKDEKEFCGFEKAQEKPNLSSSPQAQNGLEQFNGATVTTPEVGSNCYKQSVAIEQEEKALTRDSVIQVTESTNKEKVDEAPKPETTSVSKSEEMLNLSSSQSENKSEQLNGATRTTPEMGLNHYEQSAAVELQEEMDLMRDPVIQVTESTTKEKLDDVLKLETDSIGKAEEKLNFSCSLQAKNELEQLNRATKTTPEVGSNHCEQSTAIEQEEKALMKDSIIQVTESTDKEKLDEVPKQEVASGGHKASSEASSSQENNTTVQPEMMQSQTAEVKPKAVRLRSSRLSKSSSTQDELDSYFDAAESFGTLDGYESLDDFYSDPSGKEDTSLLSLRLSVDKVSTEPVSIHLDEVKAPSSKAWEEHMDGNEATGMERVDNEQSSKKLHTPLHSLLGNEPIHKEETNVSTTKGNEQGVQQDVQGHLAPPPTSTKSKTRFWSLWKHCICCPAVR